MKLGNVVGKPIFAMPRPSNNLAIADAKVGIEIEFQNWNGINGTSYWNNHPDGSLRNNGQEFVTRGGLIGEEIEAALEEFANVAEEHSWEEGTPYAGIHIHVDCTDFDLEQGHLATFTSLYMLVEHALFAFAGEWRRSCGFCEAFEDSDADFHHLSRALFDKEGSALRAVLQGDRLQKYSALNLLSLNKYGTVEFRALPTTFDIERIKDWINFILQLKKAAMAMDITTSLIAQFSKEGPAAFLARVMEGMWPKMLPYFNEERAWYAIDNAMALMSFASLVVPSGATSADLWAETRVEEASWVGKKLAAMGEAPKKAKPRRSKKQQSVEAEPAIAADPAAARVHFREVPVPRRPWVTPEQIAARRAQAVANQDPFIRMRQAVLDEGLLNQVLNTRQ